MNAIVFMYRHVLLREPGDFGDYHKATGPIKLPVVLARDEIRSLFSHLSGQSFLCAGMMYGSGLRVMETARLRVSDIEFDRLSVRVRDGKGRKSRITTLSPTMIEHLQLHLNSVKSLYRQDYSRDNCGGVYLPYSLARKYPKAPFELGWQYLFPAEKHSKDPRSGKIRRHHITEQTIQRATKRAVRVAEIVKPATCPSLRHSFARLTDRAVVELLPARLIIQAGN